MTKTKAKILLEIVLNPATTREQVEKIAQGLTYPRTFPRWCPEAIALRKAIRQVAPDLLILR